MGPEFEARPRPARASSWLEPVALGVGAVVAWKVFPHELRESALAQALGVLAVLAMFTALVLREVSRKVDGWHRELPEGPVPCPRCRAHDRTPLGWCADCAQALAQSGRAAPEQVSVFVDSLLRRDLDVAASLLAPEFVAARSGERHTLTREAWQNAMASFHRWSRRETSVVLASYGDPDDPLLGWIREHTRTQGTVGLMRLDVDLVSSYRLDARGLVVEVTAAEPLPPGGPIPAASAGAHARSAAPSPPHADPTSAPTRT